MGRVIEGAGPLRSGNPQGSFFVWDMTGNRFGSEPPLEIVSDEIPAGPLRSVGGIADPGGEFVPNGLYQSFLDATERTPSPFRSGMKQQHQPLLHLVEFTFFSAEVEPHLQSFLQRIFKGRSQGGVGIDPERGDANSSGVPPEPACRADVRLVQCLFKECVDRQS